MSRSTLVCCLITAAALRCQTPGGSITAEDWQSDLAFLVKELPARHVNAFAITTRADFEAHAARLRADIPNLSPVKIEVKIHELVASLGDGHTNISWRAPANFANLPISLYWFRDGITVISAAEEHRSLLGGKLLKIDGMAAEEACRRLSRLVPHENEAWLQAQLPWFLTNATLLNACGIAKSAERVMLDVRANSGEPVRVEVQATAGRLRQIALSQAEAPLYSRNVSVAYWATITGDGSTVYFAYNRCLDEPRRPFPEFRSALRSLLAVDTVRRVVVDLRNNAGGSSPVLDPWINEIKASPFNRKGRLFVVVGRRTFSSAILNAQRFRNDTAAILIGEDTGNKPNHFGQTEFFALPKSGLRVSYSTKHFRPSRIDSPTLTPDQVVEQTSADFAAGIDPVLAAILRTIAPAADTELARWKNGALAAPSNLTSPAHADLSKRSAARWQKDREAFTVKELQAIEELYQETKRQYGTDSGREKLKQFIAMYPRANRAGCAALDLALVSEGAEREAYLKTAIADFSDSWYGNLVQVGSYARHMLAAYYEGAGNTREAAALRDELRRDYPNAIDNQGKLLHAP